ncbi:MAG: M1 family metallopeptidase [Bacteroidia bacterium]|nr:M1 family metallopeptidase [Bacteroidia bacterium]MDW8015860.1 M1 family metallopeptidase [Bacteroidia bacterium]
MRIRLGITILIPFLACAQSDKTQVFYGRRTFTRADTLLGSLSPYRSCYDVVHYTLSLSIYPRRNFLKGEVICTFRWLGGSDTLQIDLDSTLEVSDIQIEEERVPFVRVKGTRAIWVPLSKWKERWEIGDLRRWRVRYEGRPRPAVRPPWEGGLVWSKTPTGQPWIGVTCQGSGASLWWPLKDHLSDEPDSVTLNFCVPAPLRVIANGQFLQSVPLRSDTCYTYRTSYPINTYNVTFYAAPGYRSYTDTLHSVSGEVLSLRFHLLPHRDIDKVNYLKRHAKRVLRAFEHYFGPFPPQRDGFALVESPYYGMEHQSGIAYGNEFREDPRWGFDYIILHETGHEWWGNHVTAADNADLWIQEGFCTYSEALFIEYYEGYERALEYLLQQRSYIRNRQTLQAPYGVNADQPYNTDIYYKAAWVLHTLRHRVNNDSLWFRCLRAIQDSFSFQTISAHQLISFMSRQLGENLEPFFRAYLLYLRPPVVQYRVVRERDTTYLEARWICDEPKFDGPMEFLGGNQRFRFFLTSELQRFALPSEVESIVPDRNRFMVLVSALL